MLVIEQEAEVSTPGFSNVVFGDTANPFGCLLLFRTKNGMNCPCGANSGLGAWGAGARPKRLHPVDHALSLKKRANWL
ncbi:hypothetical protein KBY58_04645 [Cyanobium sp. HWJ4-Hawea]|uniref:hypothetical protein n=1 Tax=Cyanobium sp. HWJ4-Hawea TaxID=2823713 RepID=UPI0020CF5CE3|nr:hypothetical protein [Cyanobium sp. HWJ4-Hawea]MCP9808718.1 hypothetical protein [Cyanobium sp. HWJ4-Hawea]